MLGTCVMLSRNLNPKKELLNGTRPFTKDIDAEIIATVEDKLSVETFSAPFLVMEGCSLLGMNHVEAAIKVCLEDCRTHPDIIAYRALTGVSGNSS